MTVDTGVSATIPLPVTGQRYRMLAELGRGGMATAYLAAVKGPGGFNKLVVVKRLRPSYAEDADSLRAFLDEAKLAARIDHPNVVHTHEVAFDGKNYFIAMEFVEGQSLETVFREKSRGQDGKAVRAEIPLNLHLHVLSEVLAGLHFAHELKDYDSTPLALVHRDVSPHNVVVTYEGHVKLLDFGIAKAANSRGDTSTGIVKGKAAYMPAEQFGGSRKIDRRADVFAVGVMLWQALTGRRLWFGLTDAEIFAKVSLGDIEKPSAHAVVLPELEAVCMKALARDPDDRFATAQELQIALEECARQYPHLQASPRELGAWMATSFAEQRARIQATIEERLGNASDEADDVPLLLPESSTGRSELARQREPEKRPAPARSRAALWAVVGLGALALAIGVGVRSLGREQPSATPEPASARATRVVVQVSPPSATVTIDGRALRGVPAEGEVARDGKEHELRVAAPGFQAWVEQVVASDPLMQLAVDLQPESGPRVAPAASASPGPAVSAAPARVTTGAPRPVRETKSGASPGAGSPSVAVAAPEPVAPATGTATPSPAVRAGKRGAIDKDNPFE